MKRILILFACCLGLAPVVLGAVHAQTSETSDTTNYAPASPEASLNLPTSALTLMGKLTSDGDALESGLVWRVFSDQPTKDETHDLIATAEGGTAKFDLPSGKYIVHAAFGRSGATKLVTVGETDGEDELILSAGGLQVVGEAEGYIIPPRLLRFSVFEADLGEDGERKLIARDVGGDRIVRLNAGTYHVVSSYGKINTTVRADLEVRAGRVTNAILQHRGAELALRLVSRRGGDPIASVSWSVLTEDGERVYSSDQLTPTFVLAEGSYEVNVRNGGQIYRKAFEVKAGKQQKIEVRLDLDKV